MQNFRFSDSFSSSEPVTKKEKSDHPETISNRFLMSKLVYRTIFDQLATFSIVGLFLIKGTDDQKWEVGSFWNHFQSISHVKIGLLDDFRLIWDIFDFWSLFHQAKLVYRMVFNQFGTFSILDSFSSREPMIKKEKSDHHETISNRFLMSKLVYRTNFDQFATFSIFVLYFIKRANDQKREVGSSCNHFQSISHVKIGL